jgi:hypothetical protein
LRLKGRPEEEGAEAAGGVYRALRESLPDETDVPEGEENAFFMHFTSSRGSLDFKGFSDEPMEALKERPRLSHEEEPRVQIKVYRDKHYNRAVVYYLHPKKPEFHSVCQVYWSGRAAGAAPRFGEPPIGAPK